MRAHGRQTDRGGRGVREQEDDYYGSSHGEGHNREGYGHLHESYHRDDAYRAPAAPHRSSYDANNEPLASRGHRDSWRSRDPDNIYGRHEGYQHQMAREDPAYLDREREPQHWSTRPEMDTRYDHGHNDWYDQTYSSTSYAESSSHHRHPITHDNQPSTYASWPHEDPYTEDRIPVSADDRHIERPPGARRYQFQQRKGQKHNKKFNSDSGWDRTKRRKGWDESSDARPDNAQEATERKWEPAPSWKASNPDTGGGSYGTQRYNNDRWSNNSNKNAKRSGNNQNKKRDWRQDDDSLNNWTRRSNQAEAQYHPPTSSSKAATTPSRRKYRDSVSPSRSHSPTASYRSRRSSRGRSRSRSISPSPKRRRRDYSPIDYQRGGTPSEKGFTRQEIPPPRHDVDHPCSPKQSPLHYQEPPSNAQWRRRSLLNHGGHSPESNRAPAWNPNERGSTSWVVDATASDRGRSPMPGYDAVEPPPRRRSVSSRSSRSSAHSRSRSPPGRNKTVHRLPSIDPTVPNVPAPPPAPPAPKPEPVQTQSQSQTTQPKGKKKKKKNKANGQANNHNAHFAREAYPNPSMPPPTIMPQISHIYPLDAAGDSQMGYLGATPYPHTLLPVQQLPAEAVPVNQHSLPPRFTPIKSAGFKPIAAASSSIKHFFPGDDDDGLQGPKSTNGPSFMPAQQPVPQAQPTEQLEVSPHADATPKIIYERPAPPAYSPAGPTAEPEPMESIRPQLEPQALMGHPPRSSSPPPQTATTQAEEEHPADESLEADIDRENFYKIVSQVGEGTFGKVYKAENTTTKAFVALKRIRMETERDGFPVTAMREIKLLQSLRQTNIVQLYEMMISNGSIYMVFEYMDHDLTGILSQTQFNFEDAHLKSLCHQMLCGLAYLHQKGVIHRDIKGSNILINNKGELKLADFGLARFYQKRRRSDYTNRVITLWYRPPELLLGATVYGPEVDMWSAGCIMLELFTKKPVFQGLDEIHQLDVVYKILGTPDPQRWPGIMELPWFELIKPKEVIPNNFRELFRKWMSPAALDLAEQLLSYDPDLRVTAVQAMTAPYFTQEEPPAAQPSGLATLEGEWHELETKRERAKKRRKPE